MSNFDKLGNVANGYGGSGFPEYLQGNINDDIPFIKVSDFNLTENVKYIVKANNYVSKELAENNKFRIFPKNTIVIAKVGAAVYLNRKRILKQDTIIDNNLMGIIPKIDVEFLYQSLLHIDLTEKVQQGALPSLTFNLLSDINLFVPDLPTQKRIAKILSTVDGQIEKTEAIIAKYQAIKQGMLHDLFTRGIDLVTGKLRPIPEQSPELYKPSPLGLIPKDWECVKFEKIITTLIHGGTPSTANIKNWSGSIPWVSGADFLDDFSIGEIRRYITKSAVLESSCNIVPKENILLVTRTGVGKLSKTNCEIAISQDITGIIADKNLVNNSWLYYYLQLMVKDFKKLNQGTSINGILKNDLLSKLLMLSSINEQAAIQNKIEIIDNLIKQKTLILNKNIQLKNSLMINLLSSKVE